MALRGLSAGTILMWRAFFLAIGIFACIIGAQCLVVDTYVLAGQPQTAEAQSLFNAPASAAPREMEPPEWAPWSLLSVGAVVILYSLTLNRQG
jgi:hypothetical protein